MHKPLLPLLLIVLATNAAPAWACSAAFCSVKTGAESHEPDDQTRARLGLRFEYIDSDQLRRGSSKVAGVRNSHGDREIETINRNFIAMLDLNLSPGWGLTLQLPYSNRDHSHFHGHHGHEEFESWSFGRIGDLRALGRYRIGDDGADTASLNFGLKLPTGDTRITNPAGARAEPELQPGTGSTDLLLGYSHTYKFKDSALSGFASVLWQHPLTEREDYRPGGSVSLDAGLRYPFAERWNALLQLNTQWRDRDSGRRANVHDTGGWHAGLSPGVSYAPATDVEIYAFLQQPLYQYVNGVQLTADWSAVLGVSKSF
jgi:hypothetical protein